jgi:Protein of unknown function (DUF1566)
LLANIPATFLSLNKEITLQHIQLTLSTITLTIALLAACSGGGGATAPDETPTPIPDGTPTPAPILDPTGTPAPTPSPTPTPEPTTGYGFVPNSSGGNYGYNCIKDYATGLIWEGKEPANSSLRFYGRRYTNFDNVNEFQKISVGGATYIKPTQAEVDAPTNSVGYKNAVNATALCGFTDWRIPTSTEIESLKTGFRSVSPSINTTWFPHTTNAFYITSTSEGASMLLTGGVLNLQSYRSLFSADSGGDSYMRVDTDHVRLVR